MLKVSPGAVMLRSIAIEVDRLTPEMIEWWKVQGADVVERDTGNYSRSGNKEQRTYIRFNNWDWCHHWNTGTGVKFHLHESDAPTATLFLLKFFDNVTAHNVEAPDEIDSKRKAFA